MSNNINLIILIQIDLIPQPNNASNYTIYVNISSYYININNSKFESIKYLSTLDNSNYFINKDKIINFFNILQANYLFKNNILDGYYLCFISNYENIYEYNKLEENKYLSNTDDIILLINMFNYVKSFFTSPIIKNIYQISANNMEHIYINNITYKLYKLINYPDSLLNIDNETLIYSLKHYIETIILTSDTYTFKDNNNNSYQIGKN
jgi:hypothetical protein